MSFVRSQHRAMLHLAALPAVVLGLSAAADAAHAQEPSNKTEIRAYKGLLSAAIRGDAEAVRKLLAAGAKPEEADEHGRTALHIAAHMGFRDVAWALVKGGANANAKESRNYDILTIAAVRDDFDFVAQALALGADPKAITSPYNGTALIAAAHLGHYRVVSALIVAKAPLDHVNNIGMTALIEAIVLGDGGANHIATVKLLLDAGANPNIKDRSGATPLQLARQRDYTPMAELIAKAGGK